MEVAKSMEDNSERFFKLVSVSQKIQFLFYILFPIGVILGMISGVKLISYIGPSIICTSWLVPGISIVLRAPWVAQAWLKGINSSFPAAPWNELSKGQKFSIHFYSLSCFVAAVGIAILVVISYYDNSK